MADKLIYTQRMMHKSTPSVDYNQWLKRLELNLLNQPIKIHKKSPKFLSNE